MSIPLFSTHGVGVVALGYDGVRWTNQAGCIACRHPYAEGLFIPMDLRSEYFEHCGGAGLGGRDGTEETGVSAAEADAMDKLLMNARGADDLHVDRSRLSGAMEAWFPVKGSLGGEPVVGWLVWDNCD